MNKWIVVTSINKPTPSIKRFANLCSLGWNVVVVGDLKTPKDWECGDIHYLSVDQQKEISPNFCESLPFNHYARKNLGYLYAIRNGAQLILDTDDDNFPKENFAQDIELNVKGRYIENNDWINVYSHFSEDNIWPRGLPLDYINNKGKIDEGDISEDCHIQQFLADKDPDVDAIYRLVFKHELSFIKSSPLILGKNTWTPFNSQNTIFFQKCFPLLYLPSFVSFRMTDIWRSFIALAVRKKYPFSISFMDATVDQYRNEHDLIRDFEDEVCGYLENNNIKKTLLESLEKIEENLPMCTLVKICIQALIKTNIMKEDELHLYECWEKEITKFI